MRQKSTRSRYEEGSAYHEAPEVTSASYCRVSTICVYLFLSSSSRLSIAESCYRLSRVTKDWCVWSSRAMVFHPTVLQGLDLAGFICVCGGFDVSACFSGIGADTCVCTQPCCRAPYILYPALLSPSAEVAAALPPVYSTSQSLPRFNRSTDGVIATLPEKRHFLARLSSVPPQTVFFALSARVVLRAATLTWP